jgi:uncharacterized protein YcbK (DUF882 family)
MADAPLYRRVWVRVKRSSPRRWKRGWQRIKYPTATHYSPHFTRAELNCKGPECRGKQPPAAIQTNLGKLARDLEQLRDELGHPLSVLSGYRCPAHNANVGGASQSQHMQGTAADLNVPPGAQARFEAAANRVPAFRAGGIGVYSNGGVHVDRRGWVARWNSWIRR